MSDYTYTDHTGDTLRLLTSFTSPRVILIAKGDEDCKEIHIANEDAPTVAAELLKAAGQESGIVAKSKDEVRTFDSDVLSCGAGPEEVLARDYDNPSWLYNKAANYIAIAEYVEGKASREAEAEKKLQGRRDALAAKFGACRGSYAGMDGSSKLAIDYIIELEDGK